MDEFLGFIDEIGRTRDGGYIYRFDFRTSIRYFLVCCADHSLGFSVQKRKGKRIQT